ncbi:MAG: hypothetical protein JKP98_06350 [Rhodobacteraceae bacterium]|nr:hypothetical protein [Paracoccaceae bacterium]
MIAKRLAARGHDGTLHSVELDSDPGLPGGCDLAVIGTPTDHRFSVDTLSDGTARCIDAAADPVAALAGQPDTPARMPPRRWYAPRDHLPNRVIARNRFRRRLAPGLRVLPGRWRGEAVDCPRGCWSAGPGGVPVCSPADCDFCLRCVHRSPGGAVVWYAAMQDKPRLDPAFHVTRRAEIAAQITSGGGN